MAQTRFLVKSSFLNSIFIKNRISHTRLLGKTKLNYLIKVN